MRDGIDQWIKVKCWQVRILCFNEDHIRSVIPAIDKYCSILRTRLLHTPAHSGCCTHQVRCTWCGRLLYRYGKAILYSVLIGCLMIILLMSLNSFQSSSLKSEEKKVIQLKHRMWQEGKRLGSKMKDQCLQTPF